MAHPATMLRAEAAKSVGGYPAAFPHAEDYAFWLRLRQQQVADAPAARSAAQPIDWAALLPNTPLEADDGVDDPYQCPYCGRPTEPDDRLCPHCRGGSR